MNNIAASNPGKLPGPAGSVALSKTVDFLRQLRVRFEQRFHASPRVFRAPGRVNLIGEHTDYNEGFVMPAAIEFATGVAVSQRRNRKLVVVSADFGDEREFDLADTNAARQGHWSDYVRGVAVILQQAGYDIPGANILISGNVPIGAGLSSSASVEVATALALLHNSGVEVDSRELALLAQRAENEFVGARCGIMDQFVSIHGRAGHALVLDCRSLQYELSPIPDGITMVICNSMVKHELSGGEYNARRAECEEGVRLLRQVLPGIRALRDVSLSDLQAHSGELSDTVYRRCRHVITENERVLATAAALSRGDLDRAGDLMAKSHRSLRDDYEVSCAELDLLVELANGASGVVGSRMTGGGFGGCTVNLVHNESVEDFRSTVARRYRDRTGITPQIYESPAAGGAGEIA